MTYPKLFSVIHYLLFITLVIHYADDACIVFQHKNLTEIEKQLLIDFLSLCDWFLENKLSVHFGQEKKKLLSFGTNYKVRIAKALNIVYNRTEIKRCKK